MTTSVMTQKLDAQMNLEFRASHLFITLSNWCMESNHPRFALCLRQQAQLCITHTMRVFEHIKKSGSHPIIKAVNISQGRIKSLDELLSLIYDNQSLRCYELECLTVEARENIDTSTLQLLENIHAEQTHNNAALKRHAAENILSTRLLAAS
jgi:ferritin-like protein 2